MSSLPEERHRWSDHFAERLPAMTEDLGTLVRCESPSSDHEALIRSADLVADMGTRLLGVAPERITLDDCPHLRWRIGSDTGPRALLLGHHDTVWPTGSLETHPWTVEESDGGRIARGPGCFDMLAGVVQIFHAVSALRDRLEMTNGGVTILITGDEEIGSPGSRTLIEEEARTAAACFVLEASADGGALKVERKGVSLYRVDVEGRAAHAGLEPKRGVNAGFELATQLLRIVDFADVEQGTTVTPTTLSAGTTTNTVPARAQLAVDARARTLAEQERVDAAFGDLQPVLPGSTITVTGGINRPPLERSASEDLYALAREVSAELGVPVPGAASVGGGSDGNFAAGVGTPTLDGMGAVGGGAHADHEHVLLAELPGRTALLAGMIESVLSGDRGTTGRVLDAPGPAH